MLEATLPVNRLLPHLLDRATEKDSPLLDLSDAAVKKFIKTAKARGFVTLDALNAVLPSEEVSPDQMPRRVKVSNGKPI